MMELKGMLGRSPIRRISRLGTFNLKIVEMVLKRDRTFFELVKFVL